MKIDRKELLTVLEIVKPALARNDQVEAYSHIWFSGTAVSAYDDAIGLGITAPLKTEFKGGIRGTVLLGVLSNSGAKDVDFSQGDSESLKITAGRSRFETPCLPLEQQLWKFSKGKGAKTFTLTDEMASVLKRTLIATGADLSMPETLGITMLGGKKTLYFYATDTKSVARGIVDKPDGWDLPEGERIIVPSTFLDQLLKLSAPEVLVATDCITASSGGVTIYSKLLQSEKPLDFLNVCKRHLPNDYVNMSFPIPGNMANAIERVLVVMKAPGQFLAVDMVKDTLSMTVGEQHAYGELHETFAIKDKTLEANIMVDPSLIKRGLDVCIEMVIGEKAIVMIGEADGDFLYLISAGKRTS